MYSARQLTAVGVPFLSLLLFAAACSTPVAPPGYEPALQVYAGPRLPHEKVAYIFPVQTARWLTRFDTVDGNAVTVRKASGVVAVLPGRHVVGARTKRKSKWPFRGRGKCADLVFRAEAGGVYRILPAAARGRRGRWHRGIKIVDQRTGIAVGQGKVGPCAPNVRRGAASRGR